MSMAADAPMRIDRSSTPVDCDPSLQVRRARTGALRTLYQVDVGNNHDDKTTEQGPSRDSGIALGLDCLDCG